MALVVETGSGVRGSNSYVTVAFVTSYLADRDRSSEGSWDTITTAAKEAACIAATKYIDTRWGHRFVGVREFHYQGSPAQALLTFSGNPSPSDTLTIGEIQYTFVSSLTFLNVDEVLIGSTLDDTLDNLLASLKADSTGAGTKFSESQIPNTSAVGALRDGTTDEILLTAVNFGEAGNGIPLSESSSAITITTSFQNGTEEGSQPLEFPRAGLFDRYGIRVTGVPVRVKEAAAEYAVRAASASLYQDPTVDATGRAVVEKEEQVGPISERTRYEEGSALSQLIKPYPEADRLLRDYIMPSGRVVH